METLLKLTSHEFYLLCEDFESGDFHVGIDIEHSKNVEFVKEIISIVRIEPGLNVHDDNVIWFLLPVTFDQVEKLKVWVEWSYRESFKHYLHSEDKACFLKLRNKILSV